MGVPRLTQDLHPYAENAILDGQQGEETSAVRVSNLVLDGPSLVYHVYNKLYTSKCLQLVSAFETLPTYHEINGAVKHFLDDIENSGVSMHGSSPLFPTETVLIKYAENMCISMEHYLNPSVRQDLTDLKDNENSWRILKCYILR